MRTVAVDFETFYSKKLAYGISELGAWRYCNHELFDPYMISVSDGTETWAGPPSKFNWDSLEGAELVSHNAAFDRTVYETMVRKGLAPQINFKCWHCSANLSAFLCNRRSLKDAASFLLGVELSKETRDYANGKHWGDIIADGKTEEMLAYARADALTCWQLFTRYGHLWPEKEKRLSDLTIRQGMRGIQINTDLLKKYIAVSSQMLVEIEATLPWIKEGRPPTSPKAIAEKCRAVGIPCPPVKSHFDDGEARFNAWEAAYGGAHKWIANVASWRSVNKFLESLHTISERLQSDGVFNFGLKYFGAHTGRWSGDAGFNLQNLRKVPLFRDEHGLLISDAGRLKEVATSKVTPGYVTAELDIRKLFIPRPGMRLVTSDLSQIEPRCLAKIVGDDKMLESMAAGFSPYEAAARARGEWTSPEPLKTGNKELYSLKKAQILALGYGAGPEKFQTMALALAGLDLSVQDPEFIPALSETGEPCIDSEGKPIMLSGKGSIAKKIVKEWREANPGVTLLWKQLDNALKNSAGGALEVELPSGRVMRYGQVRTEFRVVKNEETGRLERRRVTTADIGGRRYKLYGGLICENLIQSTARDIFCEALLRIEKIPGVHVLFTVHDEVVCEIEPGIDPEEINRAMSETPDWFRGCPVAAETNVVPAYQK